MTNRARRGLHLIGNAPTIPRCTSEAIKLAPEDPAVGSAATQLRAPSGRSGGFEMLTSEVGPSVRLYKGRASVRIFVAPGAAGRPSIRGAKPPRGTVTPADREPCVHSLLLL
jgi:hypothetical protein